MKEGVLLLAHGAPERVEDVEAYLGFVRGGRPGSPEVAEEVRRRYAAIGGSSPLLRWTRAQAEALEKLLGIPVFFGMRNWRPFIAETMEQVRAAGIQRLAGICLAPQFSEMSIGLYIKRAAEAAQGIEIAWAKSYHDDPLLMEAFAEKLRPLLPGRVGLLACPARKVLFTAHSLPERALSSGDPYAAECRATAAAVAEKVGLGRPGGLPHCEWDFAYQSQGMTGDGWLGPTVEACLDRYAAEGLRELVIDPIGFVCDHVEVLYDIDIQFREYGAARGIAISRPESLNGSPAFTAALAQVAKRCLA